MQPQHLAVTSSWALRSEALKAQPRAWAVDNCKRDAISAILRPDARALARVIVKRQDGGQPRALPVTKDRRNTCQRHSRAFVRSAFWASLRPAAATAHPLKNMLSCPSRFRSSLLTRALTNKPSLGRAVQPAPIRAQSFTFGGKGTAC